MPQLERNCEVIFLGIKKKKHKKIWNRIKLAKATEKKIKLNEKSGDDS